MHHALEVVIFIKKNVAIQIWDHGVGLGCVWVLGCVGCVWCVLGGVFPKYRDAELLELSILNGPSKLP